MVELAFVNKPSILWKLGREGRAIGVCRATERRGYNKSRQQTMMEISTTVSRTTKLGQPQGEPETQGPYCPLVDQEMLRHCLLCAKRLKLKRESTGKEENVKQLLVEAREALGVAQRGLAERFFLRAIVTDPGNTRTYFLYALQVQRRDPMLARELFRQGLRQDPYDAKLLQAWGLFESKQGKLARAQRLLKRSVHLEPQNAPVLRWKMLFPEERH